MEKAKAAYANKVKESIAGEKQEFTPELQSLMKKYGVDGEVDEGMKEKVGGFLRRMSDKDYIGQNRADVVAKKANVAYASGDSKKGDRYMRLISKGRSKIKSPVKTPHMAAGYSAY